MTEADWLRFTQPKRMLNHVDKSMSVRKLKLFGCASCRRIWERIVDDRSRRAVRAVEREADGLASDAEMQRAKQEARDACVIGEGAISLALRAAYCLTDAFPFGVNHHVLLVGSTLLDRRAQAMLLDDIFGNPFRPVAFVPAWLTPTALGVAAAIYDGRAFDRLPILADALEDAGCADEQVLSHCPGGGPHVRGCWVVDGVLGKG